MTTLDRLNFTQELGGATLNYLDETDFKVPLNKRIKECIEASNCSISHFARLIDMDRKKLSRIVAGQYLEGDEDAKVRIANGLGVTVDRLIQRDTISLTNELKRLILSKTLLQRAYLLAQEFAKLALGFTEQVQSNYYLGRTLHNMGKTTESKKYFDLAYSFAIKSENPTLIKLSFNGLLNYYYTTEDTTSLRRLLDASIKSEVFMNDPEQSGRAEHYFGILAEDLTSQREHYERSLQHYTQAGLTHMMGRMKLNLADVALKMNQVEDTAITLLREAVEDLSGEVEVRLIAFKDLAKVLLRKAMKEDAIVVINEALLLARQYGVENETVHKILLMNAEVTSDPQIAQQLVDFSDLPEKLRMNVLFVLYNCYTMCSDIGKAQESLRMFQESIHLFEYYLRSEWF